VLPYIVHIDRWMAAAAFALFLPQLVFVPLMQGAINRRAGARVWVLRQLGVSTVDTRAPSIERDLSDGKRIDRVLQLNMGIYKFKFSMNFLMNLGSHLQVVAALLIGGWMVHTDQLEVGGIVAFISGVGRLNDPWGDLVNYVRDLSLTQVKYRLVADRVNSSPNAGLLFRLKKERHSGWRLEKSFAPSTSSQTGPGRHPTTQRKAGDKLPKFEERRQFAAAMIGALTVNKTVRKPTLIERSVSPCGGDAGEVLI
jgi:ABC-type multidrug transport system fused ATPase/permease subunit